MCGRVLAAGHFVSSIRLALTPLGFLSDKHPWRSPAAMGRGRAVVGLLLVLVAQRCGSFNLDVEQPSVFSGPERSYFGFSVDFFQPGQQR